LATDKLTLSAKQEIQCHITGLTVKQTS